MTMLSSNPTFSSRLHGTLAAAVSLSGSRRSCLADGLCAPTGSLPYTTHVHSCTKRSSAVILATCSHALVNAQNVHAVHNHAPLLNYSSLSYATKGRIGPPCFQPQIIKIGVRDLSNFSRWPACSTRTGHACSFHVGSNVILLSSPAH